MANLAVSSVDAVEILSLWNFPDAVINDLNSAFKVWPGTSDVERQSSILAAGRKIRGIATKGSIAISTALLDSLPGLEIVSSYTAGSDGIPKQELTRRGIRLATSSSALAPDVAELAIGLALAASRQLRAADCFVRNGAWSDREFPLGHRLTGKRAGIVGIGKIGQEIASRCSAFSMPVGYINRSAAQISQLRRFDSLVQLAEWADFLFVCCPGGPETAKIIDSLVLEALGTQGVLVNVARGSVVDEAALLSALLERRLGFAALDVFQNEPNPDPRFMTLENVFLAPHIGSSTVEARAAMGRAIVRNLVEHFAVR